MACKLLAWITRHAWGASLVTIKAKIRNRDLPKKHRLAREEIALLFQISYPILPERRGFAEDPYPRQSIAAPNNDHLRYAAKGAPANQQIVQ
jgi:hypothetical protein